MDNFKHIYFFGCSFTREEDSPTGYEFINFRKIIEDKYKSNFHNRSKSGKSNQEIINDVYNQVHFSKLESDKLFVIQTTFLHRFGLYSDITDSFVSLCKRENPQNFRENVLIDFYNKWLEYFYNKKTAILEFKKQINLISAYLRENNIDFIYVGIDELLDVIEDPDFFEKNNFLNFDENKYSFYNYATLNKLRIVDIVKSNVEDYHFNKDGHSILAEKILDKINNLACHAPPNGRT
jgi:hypothetical protein